MPPKKSTAAVVATEPTRKSSRASTIVAATVAKSPRSKKVKSEAMIDDSDEEDDEDEEPASEDEPPKKKAKKTAAPKKKAAAVETDVVAPAKLELIKVGDNVDNVQLQDENDQTVFLHDLVKDQGIIIFTYPKANTPGCTSQACGFRDVHDQIIEAGFKVYGLSTDKPKAQLSWKTSKNFQYSLLSDPTSVLLNHLGATAKSRRCHFVIEKGGKLLEQAIGVSPKSDPGNALEFIKAL